MTPSTSRARRAIVFILILALLAPILAGCSGRGAAVVKPARFGSFGTDFAVTLAAANPVRTAGSDGERKTGDLIIKGLRDLGYEPIVSEFSFKSGNATLTSRNIIVRIPGTGVAIRTESFPVGSQSATSTRSSASGSQSGTTRSTTGSTTTRVTTTGTTHMEQRQVIIGAHYDATATQANINPTPSAAPSAGPTPKPGTKATPTPVPTPVPTAAPSGVSWIPTWKDFTGISDNAASIGALMVMARELKTKRNAHDVVLIAFGAGHAAQAGARDFVSRMTVDEIARTDAMYNLENIYAGDKLYANAGQNSIKPGFQKDYEKRRKLYEATDIYYEYELYSNNKVALYTNQSVLETDQNMLKIKAPFREWTTHVSDHTPFDEKGIPIVFFESFDYDAATFEAMRESNNPAFTATNGKISGTPYDSTRFLGQLFESQQKTLTPTPQPLTPTPTPSRTTPGASPSAGTGTTARTPEDEGTEKDEQLEDLLTRRINNTSFIIIMAIRKVDSDTEATKG